MTKVMGSLSLDKLKVLEKVQLVIGITKAYCRLVSSVIVELCNEYSWQLKFRIEVLI